MKSISIQSIVRPMSVRRLSSVLCPKARVHDCTQTLEGALLEE